VADPSPDARSAARDHGAATVVERADALPGVAGVIVAAPTTVHAQVVDDVLPRDVPLFVEKPLTADPGVAARLAARGNGRLFVMDKWRYHPGVQELAAIAREGRLGPVSGLATVRVGWGNPHDDSDPVWVLAPHDLAIGFEILGAFGRPESAVGQWHDGGAVHLTGVLRGDGWWQTLEVSSRSAERRRVVGLYCDDGVAVLADGWDEHVTVYRDGPDSVVEERIETPGELPLLAELRAFIDHLRGGPPPRSSAAEGAAVVSAIAQLRALAA